MRRGPVVRPGDGVALLAFAGAITLWMALTDGMLRYLRPGMRPWLLLSGLFLLAIAFLSGIQAVRLHRRDVEGHDDPAGPHVHDHSGAADTHSAGTDTPHRHGLGLVSWLLALPLVVAIAVDPSALGAYAIRQQTSFGAYAPSDFDLAEHLRANSFGGQAVSIQIGELIASANDPAQYDLLANTEIRIEGFVVRDDEDPTRFVLARLMIGCCAGDAVALTARIDDAQLPLPEEESWVRVIGTFDLDATLEAPADDFSGLRTPIVSASSVTGIDAPSQPYEYPR